MASSVFPNLVVALGVELKAFWHRCRASAAAMLWSRSCSRPKLLMIQEHCFLGASPQHRNIVINYFRNLEDRWES